jgi:hypothetical protein
LKAQERREAAAIFDRHGSISILRAGRPDGGTTYVLRVRVRSTDCEAVRRFAELVQRGSVHVQRGTRTQVCNWDARSQVAVDVLTDVVEKLANEPLRARTRLAIEFQEQKTRDDQTQEYIDRQAEYHEQMAELLRQPLASRR